MNLDDSLRDEVATNGPFEDTATLAQAIKMVFRRGRNWDALPPEAKEALELTASAVARVLTGDATAIEHWNTIAINARQRAKGLDQKGLEGSVAAVARLRTPASFGVPPIQTDGIEGDGAA